jgi:hypothetical protein
MFFNTIYIYPYIQIIMIIIIVIIIIKNSDVFAFKVFGW